MVAAVMFVVLEIGTQQNEALGIVRGDPMNAADIGIHFHACVLGDPNGGKLLAIPNTPVDVDTGNPVAVAAAVRGLVQGATSNSFDIQTPPYDRDHCWKNGGWTSACAFGFTYVITREVAGVQVAYGPNVGFLNRLRLQVRYLAVLQAP